MKTMDRARELARTLAGIGRQMGKRVSALVTRMDEPLGLAVGNALETAEAIELLRGGGPADLREVTVALTAEMLVLAGATPGSSPAAARAAARARVERAIADGSGLAKLEEIVAAQGGDAAAVRDPGRLPQAPHRLEVLAPSSGVVEAIDTEVIGLASVALGAGRARTEDRIDPAVGLVVHRKLGAAVERGEPLATLHHGDRGEDPARVAARLAAAWSIGQRAPPVQPLVLEILEDT
jgi:pyrimidine-nucleoside phosphorylase/thymidine phosphorylase